VVAGLDVRCGDHVVVARRRRTGAGAKFVDDQLLERLRRWRLLERG